MSGRREHTLSIEDINQRLVDQIDGVVDRFAPAAAGSYTLHGKYFTLNPGRPDNSVGSFYVNMSGPYMGRYYDHSTGDHGDLIDLIKLYCNCSTREAILEARAFLGLETLSPQDRMKFEKQRQEHKRRQAERKRSEAELAERRQRSAKALFLNGQEGLRDTPAAFYLRDRRAIDLAQMTGQPGALRYHPQAYYKHIDPETGEVIEGKFPALLAAISHVRHGFVAVHRTYLGINPRDGLWDKADLPETKKVYGQYKGGCIPLSRGQLMGPRGGKPASLPNCPPGSHVYLAEGIEDALSCSLLLPEVRVAAGVSLSNLGQVEFPENVSTVTLVADRDENPEAAAALQRAIASHQQAGRTVRLWQNDRGGKDLNDALRAANEREGQGAA